MGLRRKISLMALTITVFSILITASIGCFLNYKLEKENILMAMDSEVSKLNADVNNWLDQKTQVIEVLSDVIEKNHMSNIEIEQLIVRLNQDPEISDIYMGFSDGGFLSSINWEPPQNYDPRLRPWYISLLYSDQVSFSTPYQDMTSGKLAVSVGRRVNGNNGKVMGVLAEDILVDTLFKRLSHVDFKGIGYAFMMDKSGNMLAHPDTKMLNQDLKLNPELEPLVKKMQIRKNGIVDYRYENEDKVVVFQEIKRSGWILGVTVPRSVIYEPLYKLLEQYAIIFVVVATLSVLISYKLSRNLVWRINHLLQKTNKIAAGEFDEVVETSGDDEITSLSHSFNQMGDNIRRYIAELDEHNKDLEDKVSQAVQEIADKKLQLIEAEKLNSLSYLVSGVAHEMNTPIGNCIMLASYMHTMLNGILEKLEAGILKKTELVTTMEELRLCNDKIQNNLETGKDLIVDFKELSVEQIGYTPAALDLEGIIWRSYHQMNVNSSLLVTLTLTIEPELIFLSDSARIYKLFC